MEQLSSRAQAHLIHLMGGVLGSFSRGSKNTVLPSTRWEYSWRKRISYQTSASSEPVNFWRAFSTLMRYKGSHEQKLAALIAATEDAVPNWG